MSLENSMGGRSWGGKNNKFRTDHSGGRALWNDQDARPSLVGRKSSPERLRLILRFASQMPVIADICRRAGISRSGLMYWIMKSETGTPGDGFDVVVCKDENGSPITQRFHESWRDAFDDGMDGVAKAAFKLAYGQSEPLTHHGRVKYKLDPDLLRLGFEEFEAMLLDEFGRPIPETINKQDPDMIRFLLQAHRRDIYGKHQEVDVKIHGGVLVVDSKMSSEDLEKTFGGKQEFKKIEFVEVEDGDDEPA